MHEQRFITLETKLAYQEDTILQLNDALCRQQARITELESLCKHLVERIHEMAEPANANPSNHEIPPHY